jgi:hypothetical protein
VDTILVYEADKSSDKRVQRVDVRLNFIGVFPLQETPDKRSPAEIEEEQRLDALRAKRREYNRRYQAKRKVKDRVLVKVETQPKQKAATA